MSCVILSIVVRWSEYLVDRQTFDNLAKHRELDFRMQRLDNSVSDISEWLSDTMVKKTSTTFIL